MTTVYQFNKECTSDSKEDVFNTLLAITCMEAQERKRNVEKTIPLIKKKNVASSTSVNPFKI